MTRHLAIPIAALLASAVLLPPAPASAQEPGTAAPAAAQAAGAGPSKDTAPRAGADIFSGLALERPECIVYDADRDRYLIANIAGDFTAVDNNGFITAVSADGTVDTRWIAGGQQGVTLDAPKGMAVDKGRLVVADINHVRVFDLASGRPLGDYEIAEAHFLNDVAVDAEGTIYVTDTGTDSEPGGVFRLTTHHQLSLLSGGADLKRPNGIALRADGNLVVAGFGGAEVMVIGTDGRRHDALALPEGRLDGLLVRDDGSMLVTSWDGGSLVEVGADGAVRVLATGLEQPACITLDRDGTRVLVPEVEAGRITAVDIPAAE
jgi:Gluconolactonase